MVKCPKKRSYEDCVNSGCMDCLENAQTCDGCQELTKDEDLIMDPVTDLCYCPTCAPVCFADVLPFEVSTKELKWIMT